MRRVRTVVFLGASISCSSAAAIVLLDERRLLASYTTRALVDMFAGRRDAAVIRRAALCVFRELGPGLSECIYQNALHAELGTNGICSKEVVSAVQYKGRSVGFHRYDLVYNATILEIKTTKLRVTRPPAAHRAQAAKYARHKQSEHSSVVLVVFTPAVVIVQVVPY